MRGVGQLRVGEGKPSDLKAFSVPTFSTDLRDLPRATSERQLGFCRECFLAELEEAIAEEHPELKRGDVFDLVQEWLRLEDDLAH